MDTTTDDTDRDAGSDTPTRRSLLGALAAAGVAGCLGFGGEADDGQSGGGFQTVGPDGGPEPSPTPTTEPTPGRTATASPTPTSEPTTEPPESTATTAGPTTTETGAGWPSVDDPYYDSLQTDLAEMGLSPGEFVYADDEADTLSKFNVWSDFAEGRSISVADDLPFSAARRVEVTDEPENPWDVTMNGAVNNRSVAEGDVLLGVVYLRGPVSSPKDPTVQFVAKDDDNPATNMVTTETRATPSTEWTRYYVPMQWNYDSEAGTWWWELFHGFGIQTVDVGGIALVDFDRSVKVEDLPAGPADGE